MNYMTIKELSRAEGCTYEAIRRLCAKYAEELKGHITNDKGRSLLDEKAVEFIKEKRRSHPLIVKIEQQATDSEEYKKELDNLRVLLMDAQKQIIALQEDKQSLIEAKIKNQYLEDSFKRQTESLKEVMEQVGTLKSELAQAQTTAAQAKAEADQAREAMEQARAEANSYTRSLFGFYRKK